MLEDLASLVASQAVVAAAGTDAWEQVRSGLARLMGRRNPEQEQLVAQRLDETREQLAETDSEEARKAQVQRWEARFADLLDEHPDLESDLRALVEEIQAQLRAGMGPGADREVAIRGDVNISASADPIAPQHSGQEFSGRKAKLFISYSHRDERYRDQLVSHLAGLRRQGVIADWHDRKIVPGQEWRDAIDQNLDSADCVLLLISADFLASDYCYSIEMQRALEKHRKGGVLVIPVIVRPVDWQHPPLGELEALPTDAKPIIEWPRRDRAWLSVMEGLRRALAPVQRVIATADDWVEPSVEADFEALPDDKSGSSAEAGLHAREVAGLKTQKAELQARMERAKEAGVAGDPAAARDQYAALIPVLEWVLGPEHPDTLDARDRLAGWTGQAGDPAASRDQYAALVPVFKRVLGPEHRKTLIVLNNLAVTTGQAGDSAGARDQFAELVRLHERLSGAEDPNTLSMRTWLARATGLAGDPVGARDQFAEVVRLRGRLSGAEGLDNLFARNDLATWTGEAGDPVGARDQFAALVPIWERVLGPDDGYTQEFRNSLAYWTREVGEDS